MGTELAPASLTELMNYAERVARSNFVPPAYKGKAEDALVAMQMGAELGLAPLQSLQNIACINGKPSIYGDAALALVKASKVCEDVREAEIAAQGDAYGYECVAVRKGKSPVRCTFTVSDAKRAGLWDKAGPWKQYPKRMLQMRARGFALRDAFPDVLRGLITAEEAGDFPAVPAAQPEKEINPVGKDAPAPASLPPSSGQNSLPQGDEDPTDLPQSGVPLYVPGRSEAYAVSADVATWRKDYKSLEDRVLNAKDKKKKPLSAKEKHAKVLALWETNEPRLVELGTVPGEVLGEWRKERADVITILKAQADAEKESAAEVQP